MLSLRFIRQTLRDISIRLERDRHTTCGFAPCRPSQPVCRQRVTCEGRSTVAISLIYSVSVCEIRTWKRHFRPPFLRWASFGVSFSRNVPCRTTPSAFFLNWRRGGERGRTTRWTAYPFVVTEFASTALGTGRRRAFEVDVLGFRRRLLFAIQDNSGHP
jgi:hypothetical protein